MMSVERINYEEFRPFLDSLSLISVSSEWADFVKVHFGAKSCYFGVFEGGHPNFIIPAFETLLKELIGVPKFYTEFVATDGDKKTILAADISNFFKANNDFHSIKFSICPILNPDFPNIEKEKGVKIKRFAHILRPGTFNEDEVLTKIVNHKTRNQVVTSIRRGNFEVRIGPVRDFVSSGVNGAVDEFYKLYLAAIKRLKSIPKELKFFRDLEKSFKENFQIIFAYRGQTPAGANLALIKNKYLHLMFNISDARFFKDYVNDFIYWETIKFGLAKGIEIFDFGPSSVKDKSHHHFKEGFGAKPVPIFDFASYNSLGLKLKDLFLQKFHNLKLRAKKYV